MDEKQYADITKAFVDVRHMQRNAVSANNSSSASPWPLFPSPLLSLSSLPSPSLPSLAVPCVRVPCLLHAGGSVCGHTATRHPGHLLCQSPEAYVCSNAMQIVSIASIIPVITLRLHPHSHSLNLPSSPPPSTLTLTFPFLPSLSHSLSQPPTLTLTLPLILTALPPQVLQTAPCKKIVCSVGHAQVRDVE